jgi:hypothetical protein
MSKGICPLFLLLEVCTIAVRPTSTSTVRLSGHTAPSYLPLIRAELRITALYAQAYHVSPLGV